MEAHDWTRQPDVVGIPEVRLVDVYEVPEAIAVLYRLLEERSEDDDVNISHKALPSFAEHEAFFHSRPFAGWYLVNAGKEWIGYISVTQRNEIGIVLFQRFRGRGYGSVTLKTLIDNVKPLPPIPSKRPGCFVANINPKNARSIALFESFGFRHIQNTYELDV